MERSEFRILVLDDERDWRRANERTLTRAGFSVQVTSTGEEALDFRGAESFHMAVLDINLPDCDGSELVAYYPPLRLLQCQGAKAEGAG